MTAPVVQDEALRDRLSLQNPQPQPRPRLGKDFAANAARRMTKTEHLLAQLKANPSIATEEYLDEVPDTSAEASRVSGRAGAQRGASRRGIEEGGVFVSSKMMRRIAMWKPLENGGWRRFVCPASNIVMNLTQGCLANCPDCDDDCGPDVNSCPGRPPVYKARCPECGRAFADPGDYSAASRREGEPEDPMEIKLTEYSFASTPRQRLEAMVRDHMLAVHPAESNRRGFGEHFNGPRMDDTSIRLQGEEPGERTPLEGIGN